MKSTPKAKVFKRSLVTCALPYANGPVHIGHLAGVYLPADIYVRYLRSCGRDVLFVSGSDEHGVPIVLRARQEGKSPLEITQKYHRMNKESFASLGISFDIFSRTSTEIHHKRSSKIFTALHDKGLLFEKTTLQFYDESEDQFLADRYIQGTCPHCDHQNAYGDQCESCGSALSPEELRDAVSVLSGTTPQKRRTKHWYFPLDTFQGWLGEYIIEGHREWRANAYGQCKGWIDGGLRARPMTRDLDWGVPVPVKGGENKVLYVWFDAPIGYISATQQWAAEHGKDWKTYWKDPETRLIHFIGKDNIVFHCIIFPAILKAEGSYILPDQVPASEFLNLEGEKISTSRNHAIWLHEYLRDMPGQQDVLRYVLTAIAPETSDADFTWKEFQARNNSELVGAFGNFVNRVLVMVHRHFDGKVPQRGELENADTALIDQLERGPSVIAAAIEGFRFREALQGLIGLARQGNQYLAKTEPWHLVDRDVSRLGTILNLGVQVLASLSILCEPFLPVTAAKMGALLGTRGLGWGKAGNRDLVPAGRPLDAPVLLFKIIEDEAIQNQSNKLKMEKEDVKPGKADPIPSVAKPPINFSQFSLLDLRVATVLSAEPVEGSRKLLKIEVDLGSEKRTILSGIARDFGPDKLVGSRVVVVCNLEPRTMMGIQSNGMILFAENADDTLALVVASDAENGAAVL